MSKVIVLDNKLLKKYKIDKKDVSHSKTIKEHRTKTPKYILATAEETINVNNNKESRPLYNVEKFMHYL